MSHNPAGQAQVIGRGWNVIESWKRWSVVMWYVFGREMLSKSFTVVLADGVRRNVFVRSRREVEQGPAAVPAFCHTDCFKAFLFARSIQTAEEGQFRRSGGRNRAHVCMDARRELCFWSTWRSGFLRRGDFERAVIRHQGWMFGSVFGRVGL